MLHGKLDRRVRKIRSRRSGRAAYMEYLESRVLMSFTGTDVSGTWSLAGMGAAGTMEFDGSGLVTGGSLHYDNGLWTTPTGTYAIGPVSGAFSETSDLATKTGAMNLAKDLMAVTTPGGDGDYSNTLSVLVKHTATVFSDTDLNGTWPFFINGDDSGNTGVGNIIFDGSGGITGGEIIDAEGTTTLTAGNYTVSAGGQVTVVLNILRGVDAGEVAAGGWINNSKDVLVLNPPDLATAAAEDSSRLIVGVRQSGAYTNADLHTTWEFIGDGFKGQMVFDGAGHVRAVGVNESSEFVSLGGVYSVAADGTFTVTLDHRSESMNYSGAMNAGRDFAVITKVPDAFSSNADSMVLLVNTGGLTSGVGVPGAWTVAGTDVQGVINLDDTSVPPTGTASAEIPGQILGGSLTDLDGQVEDVTGTYVLTANGGITITSGATRSGSYNSSKDVMAVVRTDADNALSVLVSGGGVAFSESDLGGDWFVEFNGNTVDSNGGGTIHFDGEGGISSGTLTTAAGREQVVGGNYNLNADGTISLLRIEMQGGDTVEFVGAMNARKDVMVLSPTDPQVAAAFDMPNLTLAVRASGAYTAASVKGWWSMATEGGLARLYLNGAGAITGGVFTDASNQTSSFTGSYTVKATGGFTASVRTSSGTVNFTGAVNASRNVIIQNATGGGQTQKIGIMTSVVNRAATMTAVTPLNLAVVGQAATFGYSDLLTASNAADLDGDALTFRIASLGVGNLTINGSPATVGQTIVAGDSYAWTPPEGTGGTFTAFSVTVTDGSTNSTAAAAVGINAIVPMDFAATDMSGTWLFGGVGAQGTVEMNGMGDITGGLLTDGSGALIVPGGTYTVDPNGGLTVMAGEGRYSGAVNSSKDVAVFSNQDENSLAVIVNRPVGGDFSDADLTGTWTLEFSGNDSDSNGGGVMTFDGAGHITSGQIKTGSGIRTSTGNYTVNTDGSVSVVMTIQGDPVPNTLTGALNNSKDVLVLGHEDFPGAAANDSPLLIMLTRSAGTYGLADVKGTWFINGDGVSGLVTFDGKGHVLNAMVTGNFGDVIATVPGTGSYAMSSAGKLTITLSAKVNGVANTMTLTGAMNAGRNLMIANRAGVNYEDNLIVFTSTQDHAPTLKTIAAFPRTVGAPLAIGTLPFEITYDELRAAATGMADLDGDTLQFRVTAVGGGSFKLNAQPAAAPFLMSAGDTLEWTPLVTATGSIKAFSVQAFDGKLTSATAVPVVVKTVVPPMISVSASKPTGSELNGLTTAYGQFTITRAYGDIKQPLTVNFTIGGTAVNGVDYVLATEQVNFTAGQTTALVQIRPESDTLFEGPETAVLTLVTDSDTMPSYRLNATRRAATVKITDVLPAPLAISGATKNSPFQITYDELVNAAGVTSAAGNPITFKVAGVKSGTMKVNDVAVKAGTTTISSGDTITWTPALNAVGTRPAFGLTLLDGVTTSVAETFSVIVV